jgi:nucleotide-binding universal stress UspA family protein
MFTQILVPLDGSTLAEQALPIAARIARTTQGSILLVRVVSIFQGTMLIAPGASPIMAQTFELERHEAEKYLANITASPILQDIPVTTSLVSGPAVSTILDVAKQQHCDLIILSSHGMTGLERWLIGNVAQKIVRYSTIPTIVVPGRGSSDNLIRVGPKRILVALDGSAVSEVVLEPAAQLCSILSSPERGFLHLVHVVQPIYVSNKLAVYAKEIEEENKEKARVYLQNIVQHIQSYDLAATLQITFATHSAYDIAYKLIHAAESGEQGRGETRNVCDMIALATHGRTGIPQWFLGNTAERMLGTTTLPLLIVRPQEEVTGYVV